MKNFFIFLTLFFQAGISYALQEEIREEWGFNLAHSEGLSGDGINILVIDAHVFADDPALGGHVTALSKPKDREKSKLSTHGLSVSAAIVGQPGYRDITGGAPNANVYSVTMQGFLAGEYEGKIPNISIISMSQALAYKGKQAKIFYKRLEKLLVDNDALLVLTSGNYGRMILDKRLKDLSHGKRMYQMFENFPNIRKHSILVNNITNKQPDYKVKFPKKSDIDFFNTHILPYLNKKVKNGSSYKQMIESIDSVVEETMIEFLKIENEIENFDAKFKKFVNDILYNKYQDLHEKLESTVDNYDPEKTINLIETFLKTFISQKIDDDLKYYLSFSSNRPGVSLQDLSISAPGHHIMTATVSFKGDKTKYKSKDMSGTSISAPIVSSSLALMFEKFPELSALEIKELLLQSSYKSKYPTLFGYGILNLRSALELD